MPIKPEEALEVFGIEDLTKFETPDAFKAEVEKKWITKDAAYKDPEVVDKIWGKMNRGFSKELSDLNDAFELGLEDIDKKKPMDILKALPDAFKPRLDKVKELEEKLKTAAPADVVSKYEEEKKELHKKLSAFEKSAKEWEGKYSELDTKVKTSERTGKINGEWDGALKAISFAPTVDELRKEGFIAKAKAKYQVLLDDEGQPYAANEKGEPLMNPKKAAERWTLKDALAAEAANLKLTGVNPQGGKPIVPPVKREHEDALGRFGPLNRRPPAQRLQ